MKTKLLKSIFSKGYKYFLFGNLEQFDGLSICVISNMMIGNDDTKSRLEYLNFP